MGKAMKQSVVAHKVCDDVDDFAELENELPLAFRFRRSWTEGDILGLRNATEDGCELGTPLDSAFSEGGVLADSIKFVKDSESTQDGDSASTVDDSDKRSVSGSSEWTIAEECMDSPSSRLNWADLANETLSPESPLPRQSDVRNGPPGSWATPSPPAACPPGQWAGPGVLTAIAASAIAKRGASKSISKTKTAATKIRDDERTTILLRNLPGDFSRDALADVLDREGFAAKYDFVYVPADFKIWVTIGHAFVNMNSPSDARAVERHFEGFRWPGTSGKACEVMWSGAQQGLEPCVEKFRDSNVMHELVPDMVRPAVYQGGVRAVFPLPTKDVEMPRIHVAGELIDFVELAAKCNASALMRMRE